MGLFDKLKGTKRPEDGVEPQSADAVERALLDAGSGGPFVVRQHSDDGADLIAEWRIEEPEWRTHLRSKQVDHHLQILMRLDEAEHEVRAVDKVWKVTWKVDGTGDDYELSLEKSYSRGVSTSSSFQGTVSLGDDGSPDYEETFSFSSQDMKGPLQEAATGNGWTWRGVAFGKL